MTEIKKIITGVDEVVFPQHGDDRGELVAIEGMKDVDFDIKRIYYVFATGSNAIRGKHAHKDIKQVLLCVRGSCDILVDNGRDRKTVKLNQPNKGLYIHGFIWRELMNFTEDAVVLAVVDKSYDKDDYIFDYGLVK